MPIDQAELGSGTSYGIRIELEVANNVAQGFNIARRKNESLNTLLSCLSKRRSGVHEGTFSATRGSLPRQLTVKVPVLVAVPPGVVTPIFPVLAPVGTVAVISV